MPGKALRAIRRFCMDCQGGHSPSVLACKDTECLLYPLRLAGMDERAAPGEGAGEFCEAQVRPLRVIRRYCLVCAGSRAEARDCDAKDSCPLWSYRFGVMPATFKRVVARRKKQRVELTLPGLFSS